MATAIAEPPHLTADLKALYLSTVRVAVASPWPSRPPASVRRQPTTWRSWCTWR